MGGLAKRRWPHVLVTVAGVVLSALLASTAFVKWHVSGGLRAEPRFPLGAFVRALPHQWPAFLIFACLAALVMPSRAVQWQRALSRRVPWRDRYHFIAIGAFIHNVLPGKLGDLSRAFLLARTQRMPFVRVLGSVVVCKLMEFTATTALVALALGARHGRGMAGLSKGVFISVGACAGFIALVVALAHFSSPLARGLERRGRARWLQRFLHEVALGLGTARSFRGMLAVLALSFPGQLATSLAYGVALQSVGVPGGWLAGPLVVGALSLSQSVPGMPSDVGLYYLVTAWVARALGATAEGAAVFAVTSHLATLVPQLAQGGISLAVRRIRWKDLKASTHVAAEEAKHVARADAAPEPA